MTEGERNIIQGLLQEYDIQLAADIQEALKDGIKIYDSFENSDVTGKRDFKKLKEDREGFFSPCDNVHLYKVNYTDGMKPTKQKVLKADI